MGPDVRASSSSSRASQHLTPEEECEALLNALVPIAERMLSKYRVKDKQDAVDVRLDHVSGYSVKVLLTYAFSKRGV